MHQQNPAFEHDKKLFEEWQASDYYKEKLIQRLQIGDACRNSREARIMTEQLCREDPVFFIEMFGFTYDPRGQHEPHHLPFILFDYQKDVIGWILSHIRDGKDGLIEKSRDMGVTWLLVWVFYWMWLFADDKSSVVKSFSGLLGSYKEVLVDDRAVNSMFGMLDYCIQSTPKWLLPKRFKFKDNRHKLKLVNPQNFNIISGDTMNPDFSRGSRRSVVFMDEGASWEYFKDAWESAGDTTPCRITCSTPKGRNQFSRLKESGKIDVLTIHWKLHPLKDSEWYEYQKQRRTDEDIAQELDISYHRSQEGRVYPEWDNVVWGSYPYNDSLPLYVSWDFGNADDTAIIWFQYDGREIRIIDAYSNRGKTIDFYIPFVTGIISSDSTQYSKSDYEVINLHKNWKSAIHFGDPAGRFKNQVVNKSVMDVLREYNIHVNFREDAKDFQTRRTETKLFLRKTVVNKNDRTDDLGIAIENAAYPMVRSGGAEEVRSLKPKHDWTSHYRSSLEYAAVNFNRIHSRERTVFDKFQRKERGSVRY